MASSQEIDDDDNDFFGSFVPNSGGTVVSAHSRAQDLLAAWLDKDHPKQDFESDVTFLGEQALVKTFLKYNTPLPSSAAVERLFSTGKDVLRAKRASLSDGAFDALMFLKGNCHIKNYL
jgi:hypothetical protein